MKGMRGGLWEEGALKAAKAAIRKKEIEGNNQKLYATGLRVQYSYT